MALTEKLQTAQESIWSKLTTYFALLLWLGGIHFNLIIILTIFLSNLDLTLTITFLTIWISLGFLPTFSQSKVADNFSRFICKNVIKYFPVSIHIDEESHIDPKKTYVIAMEPHSILPIGLIGLTKNANLSPFKNNSVALATSAIFYVPLLKFVWGSLGLVPATRENFAQYLRSGISVALVPGGVQECLHMRPEHEVVFLKKRFGFVKLAIQAGAPIIPTFVFGQTKTYKWWFPRTEWFKILSRKLGFAPLIYWGIYGSPIPFKTAMTLVVGKPIEVKENIAPSKEEVQQVLEKVIQSMEALFLKYQDKFGNPDAKFMIA